MARKRKVHTKWRDQQGSKRRMAFNTTLRRDRGAGPYAFEACVRVGVPGRGGGRAAQCAYGKNPRKAIGAALKKMGARISRSKGAFAGTATRTEVRSPTSTSTKAHTQGNWTMTVTGGAGAGATNVSVNPSSKAQKRRKHSRRR